MGCCLVATQARWRKQEVAEFPPEIEWAAAGRPERSDKDVEQIFQRFCKPCRWYDRRRRICRGCGCRVADTGFAITNKIKMATEHCPRKLW